MLCPKTGKGCCDDLCHGSGCLEMDGYAMLAECDVCGGIVDEEIPDCSTCICGNEDYDDDWPDDDEPRKQQASPELQRALAEALALTPNAEAQGRFCPEGKSNE